MDHTIDENVIRSQQYVRDFVHKQTGEVHTVVVDEDYYGMKKAGYRLPSGEVVTFCKFNELYEAQK